MLRNINRIAQKNLVGDKKIKLKFYHTSKKFKKNLTSSSVADYIVDN